MPVALKGSTSGQVTLDVPSAAGTNTLTLPAKTGNIITSADSGTVTQTMMASGVAGNGPAVIAYGGSATSYSTSTNTRVAFNTKVYDTGGCFNNTGSTTTLNGISVPAYCFAPNVAGFYLVAFGAQANLGSASQIFESYIDKNNSVFAYGNFCLSDGNGYASTSASSIIYLNGTSDYVAGGAWQGTGSTRTGSTGQAAVWFTASLLRSA